MLRKTIVALGVAAAAGQVNENCGGAMSVQPQYCLGARLDGLAGSYCSAAQLQVGDTVPLRIRVKNGANYDDADGDTVYVPAFLQKNKYIQIVFACLSFSCVQASGTALKYVGRDPSGNLDKWGDQFSGATYIDGPCPADFQGLDLCSAFSDAGGKCGCVKMPPRDIPIAGNDELAVAEMIFMTANEYLDAPLRVHVASDGGFLETVEGICSQQLTGSGAGTAQAEFLQYSPPSSPPPPPPPPPPSLPVTKVQYACVKYNKCHKCDAIPAGACLYAGDMDGPCLETCAEVPDEWLFDKKWGACSSACPVSVSKDPHLHLPHGGRADFRGKDHTVFNLLSAKDVAFNVLFEASDFAWATRLVHGTKMAAGYWVITTSSGKTLNVEYAAEKFDPVAVVHEEGHPDVHVHAGTPALIVDDLIVSMTGKTLTVRTGSWVFTATTSPYPFGKLEVNKNKVLLDVAVQPLYNPDADPVAPHGILGQAYDQDKIAVDGKLDAERAGESTTAAQAEGAIEGTWEDYIVPSKFSVDFAYSRFGLAKAAPRDVSKLTGTKRAATAGAVGVADVLAASK